MNILFIATESVPYCKTGGVADVVRGLARELYVQGHDVRVVIPCYRGVLNRKRMEEIVPDLSVSLGAYFRKAIVWKANDQPMTYLIDHYFYFDRDNLYGYLDDYERFIFFTRATLEMLSHPAFQQKENNWLPQIIQGFDWVTGFIPFWLSDYGKDDPMFASSRFVLSIQNIKDVGIFGNRTLRIAIPQEKSRKFFPQIGEENERISFLGRGILFADKLVTVNPEYGAQNPLPESAQHLASAIADRVRQGNFVGIHNAIDYKQYDPSEDPHIDTHFKEYSLANRVKNKLKLQQEFGFEQGGRIPMIGMVSQLIPEKGFDLFPGFKEQLLDAGDVQFIALLEPGNPLYTTMFYTWEQEWREQKGNQKPWRKLAFGFDERLARRIYAGCDILLFPFKEDQCGAQQFIAMRYGAILVVHETGALRDAVMHYKPGMNLDNCKGQGVGFSFTEFTSEAFIEAVRSAIDLYNRDQQTWDDIQRHNMREDFSWFQPAKLYLQVYQDVLRTKRIGIENGEPLQLNRDAQLLQTLLEIDSLPGLHVRNPQAMLKQAARLVRETIQCDAVYVWTVGEGEQASFEYLGSQKIQLVSQSLDHHETRMPPDEETLNKLLNQGTMGTLKRFIDLDRSRICQPIPNLYNSKSKKYDSKWAEKEHWMYGWSVPITAHLRVLGRIDVLFRQKLEPHDYEWITRALATIANSFGFRLEQIRLAEDADQISETAKELLNVQSITEAIRKVIERAKHFSYADDAWLYLLADNDLKPTEPSTRAEAGTEIAKTAFAKKEVVYITDLTTVPYEHKEGLRPVHSLMAIPLMNLENKALGVLVLAKEKPAAFSREKEQALINYFAPQAAAALQTNQWHEQRDQNRVDQLKKLAASLIGGGDFNRLLEDVVTTTAEILESQAASLYLVNKDTGNLEIKAAAGYHKPLLDKNVFYYSRGEKGITSWIWKEGRIFKADSLEELHGHPAWAGKTKDLQGREPNAYLGIPLKIVDRKSNEEHVIGVLKFEDRKESWSRHSFIFTEEDVHLGKMMANIIATVVYNTQLSEEQLRELSTNLGKLSGALAGSQDTQTLMDNIVNTIAEVLHVDAASLYLANEDSTRLVIQAASGYQKPLVAAGAFYEWGEGVTGRIAQTKMPFQANELKVLREKGGSEKGKWDHLQENKRPVSFYGLPLRVQGRDKPIGVLKAESLKYRPFTIEDVSLIEMMGNVIATVVYNAQLSEERLRKLSSNLGKLSGALVGSQDMQTLMDNIVNTIAEVLHVDAASIYLANEESTRLVIKAASGYQKPLVAAGAFYEWGEGVTGRIAQTNRPFQANKLKVLREKGGSVRGKWEHLQGNKRPVSFFYGLPLRVQGRDKPTGVLTTESLKNRPFTIEDVSLIEMMGNVIATVVYNAQLSEERLRKLSSNLGKLSGALVGSQDTQTLMDNIVNTIAEVLHVDAASLYLANEDSTRLVIQAASGYQKPLVAAGAFYEWGEGVTGRIAQTKMPFQANELKVLREKGGSEKGKWDHLQENKRPVSFYGLPLRVQGRDKPIGVLKAESLKYRPFTIEDVSLIEMMGNVIATVVYNAQTDRARIESILKNLGSIYKPKPSAAQIILEKFARSLDRGTLELLATILSATIGADKERAYNEAIALLKIAANPELYTYIADASQEDVIQRRFRLFYQVLRTKGFAFEQLGKAFEVSHQWLKLEEESSSSDHFGKAVEAFMQIFKMACKAEIISQNTLDNWWGILLDTSQTFENTYLPAKLAFAFHLNGLPQEQDLEALRNLLAKPFGNQQHVVLPLWCEEEEFVRTRTMLRNKLQQTYSIDTIVIDIEQIQRIVGASQPDIELQRVILPRISLLSISPYKIVGPTDAQIFFGREQELRQIGANVHKTSFAVIGGRRIGKTSILHQLHFVRLPAIGFRTVLYEPSPDSSEVTYEMFLAENIRSWRPEPPSKPPLTFGELLRITHSDKPLVLLLDEADKFVPADRAKGWPLFNALRALLNLRHAQIVLSGEHALREAFRDPDSPLANFANEILLGPLDFQAVEELITQPMKQLEIDLVDKKSIVDRIWAFTSGHPSVVQRLCGRLIDRLNDRLTEQAIRCITQDDVNSIIEEPKFQREDFLDIYCSMFKVFV
jgi:starch synthase